ncbi:LARGE xylosyl- and glucuronyltransferase 2 [Schistosoma japonicum]|nr:LARGE xylosyl- and glucuronyltransferase 2 [Schistosoma japonicum]
MIRSINRLRRIMTIHYRLILLLMLCVLLCMFIWHEIKHSSMIILNNEFDPSCTYKTMPIHKPFYYFQNTTMHIAMLLAGDIDNCYQAETQIKSILLNQRRWYSSSEDNCCRLKHFTQSNSDWLTSVDRVHSYTGDQQKRSYIVFHFIVDQLIHECLHESMTDWNLEGISVPTMKSGHYSGQNSYLKLLITQILPNSIDKVILIDSDILWNEDISNLWNLFDDFNRNQCIGIVAEQNPTFYYNMGQRFWPTLGYGYNAGVLLFHLSRLRARGWDRIWMKIGLNLMNEKGVLPTAEQDVINAVLNQNKRWLYEIPCEWNIQLSAFSRRERCPVVWKFSPSNYINHEQFLPDNILTSYPIAKLLHFNAHVKPEYFFPTPLRFPSTTDGMNEFHSTGTRYPTSHTRWKV